MTPTWWWQVMGARYEKFGLMNIATWIRIICWLNCYFLTDIRTRSYNFLIYGKNNLFWSLIRKWTHPYTELMNENKGTGDLSNIHHPSYLHNQSPSNYQRNTRPMPPARCCWSWSLSLANSSDTVGVSSCHIPTLYDANSNKELHDWSRTSVIGTKDLSQNPF